MKIYGAGMAGLLAAGMLRRHSPVIYEAKPSLPNNHAALLRFRSDIVSQVTGIPFKQVEVQKGIILDDKFHTKSTIPMNNEYSKKVSGRYQPRSSVNLNVAKRYIAPEDFISQISRGCTIKYDSFLTMEKIEENDRKEPIISTIPMPTLMNIVGWPIEAYPEFEFFSIWSLSVEIEDRIDLYQTIYYPENYLPHYRASITGNKLIIEFIRKVGEQEALGIAKKVARHFGIFTGTFGKHELKGQTYGKISPTNESRRREFMLAMTDQYNIYSVGRFATWRQLLLDDVVNDINKVAHWVDERDSYQRMKDAFKTISMASAIAKKD